MPGGIRIYALGRFGVYAGDRLVLDDRWSRRKAKALPKLMVLRGRTLHRDQVLDALWPELDTRAAAANLYKNLHYLRRHLAANGCDGEFMRLDNVQLELADSVSSDVADFRRLAAHALNQPADDADAYEQALALYAGEALPDDLYEDWAQPEREQLRGLRLRLLARLSRLFESRGQLWQAGAALEELLAADELNEEAHRGLMRCYAGLGQRHEALLQYQRCREALARALGAEPSPQTQALYHDIMSAAQPGTPETQAPVAAAASSGPGRRVAVPVLYGRAAELHLLEELLAALSAGAGGGLIVRAAAGMGKSSLLRYLLDIAEQRGVLAFGSRSYEAENKLPSQSLAEMSAQMAAGADAPGGLEESFHLADFISRFATQRPIVLGFDDLYLADEVTLQLVHRLFRLAQRHAILLVATFRPWEGSQSRAFLQLLTSLRREGFMRELTLGPLDAATTRLVAGQQFEPEAVDAELLDDIAGEAGGNPFFAAELARSAIASGRASRAGGTWRLTSPTPIPVPRTVRDVFDRALERLAPLAADMLRVVAVAGADFDMALLSSILQAPEEQLVEALEQLMAAGLMAETQGAYVLGHSLLRRIVFERLTPPRRQLLLRRVAEAVAQRGAAEGQEKV